MMDRPSSDIERKLAAIMFTDIVGYTALMAESEEKGLRVRARHRELVRPLVERYHGESIEARGDESLSVFPTAFDAVNCALAIQNAVSKEPELKLHLGIHLGDLVVHGGEVSGDGVNIASRLCSLSEGGGLCVSGEVYRSIRNQPGIEAVPRGEQQLKNVPEPVAVYAVSGEAAPPRAVSKAAGEPARRVVRALPWLGAAVVVIALAIGWWLNRPAADLSPIRSIAVLPLENLSGDPEQEYFADGLTEEMINALVKVPGLRVAARTSSFAFKRRDEDVRAIGGQLDVDAVVEGSVRKSGDRLRITAQLVRTQDGFHIWSDAYDRELEDVFEIQSEIARSVVKALRVEVGGALGEDLLVKPPTADLEAYNDYLRGRHHLYNYTPGATRRAIQYFERALARDQTFALAHAGLADAYSLWSGFGLFSGEESRVRAKAAALRALELEPDLAEAHSALGLVQFIWGWDFSAAGQSWLRAIELNPGATEARLWHANLFLGLTGRHEEAIAEMEEVLELDPLSPMVQTNGATRLYLARRLDEAAERLERIVEAQPTYLYARHMLAKVYMQQRRYPEAAVEFERWLAERGEPAEFGGAFAQPAEGLLGFVHAVTGQRAEALALLEEMQGRSKPGSQWPLGVAIIYMGLGETDQAFDWFDRAIKGRRADLWMKVDPLYDPLRSDPRFDDLLRRIGFPES